MKYYYVIRQSRGLTQLQLAHLAKCGISQTLLSLAERGFLTFRADQLEALGRVLGANPDDLLRDVGPVPETDTQTVSHA